MNLNGPNGFRPVRANDGTIRMEERTIASGYATGLFYGDPVKSAAAGGGILSTFNKQKPEIRNALKIIYKTRLAPPHAVMANSRVLREYRDQVRRAFLEMSKTEKGRRLLEKIPMRDVVAASVVDYRPMASWGLEKIYIEH